MTRGGGKAFAGNPGRQIPEIAGCRSGATTFEDVRAAFKALCGH
jgi:hypothetical protein